jgi:hypothetical protein
VLDHIAPTALPRSSIIVSDEPLSGETNYRTEFVTVLNNQPQGGFVTRIPKLAIRGGAAARLVVRQWHAARRPPFSSRLFRIEHARGSREVRAGNPSGAMPRQASCLKATLIAPGRAAVCASMRHSRIRSSPLAFDSAWFFLFGVMVLVAVARPVS